MRKTKVKKHLTKKEVEAKLKEGEVLHDAFCPKCGGYMIYSPDNAGNCILCMDCEYMEFV